MNNESTVKFSFVVDGDNFECAGMASEETKSKLKKLGVDNTIIRRIAICMYEAEINMVIHAEGGTVDVDIFTDRIEVVMQDKGKGIADIELAMKEGYSTATDEIRSLGFGAGMGLPNIKKNSDDMKVESTVGVGTCVKMCFNM